MGGKKRKDARIKRLAGDREGGGVRLLTDAAWAGWGARRPAGRAAEGIRVRQGKTTAGGVPSEERENGD